MESVICNMEMTISNDNQLILSTKQEIIGTGYIFWIKNYSTPFLGHKMLSHEHLFPSDLLKSTEYDGVTTFFMECRFLSSQKYLQHGMMCAVWLNGR